MAKKHQAQNKTQPTNQDVAEFIAGVSHAGRREDAQIMLELMQRVSGEPPRLWGPSIIGFGSYHYVYDSGREGDGPLTGFSPRKANMVVYVMPGFAEYEPLLEKLGKHKTGKSCLYLGRLAAVDLDVLEQVVAASLQHMRKKYSVK